MTDFIKKCCVVGRVRSPFGRSQGPIATIREVPNGSAGDVQTDPLPITPPLAGLGREERIKVGARKPGSVDTNLYRHDRSAPSRALALP
jgi:hypothetical protein